MPKTGNPDKRKKVRTVTDFSGVIQEIEVINKTRTAQLNSAEKYGKKFDDIRLRVPVGMGSQIQAYVKENGYASVNAWLNDLIKKELEK